MGETNAERFTKSKILMRQHPEWTAEQVAEHLAIPRAVWGVIYEARRELVTTENMEPFPS